MDFLSGIFNGVKGLFGGGSSNPGSGIGKMMPAGTSTYGPNNVPFNMPQPGQSVPFAKGNSFLNDIFPGGVSKGIMGAGLDILGNVLAPKVKQPNINELPNVKAFQQFSQNPPQLPQNMQDEINKSSGIMEEEQLRRLRDVYKNARPGTDYTTDSAYQRDLANLQRSQASNRVNALIDPTLKYHQAQGSQLAELAQMDVYDIMMKTGMSAQEADDFKQMFSNFARPLYSKATGTDYGSLMEAFK